MDSEFCVAKDESYRLSCDPILQHDQACDKLTVLRHRNVHVWTGTHAMM
jgi:hypothetical protein